ncbi:peptide-methionine (R)-S-oxide reductase [Mitsuokella sp. oral taxon 131]
MYCDVTMEQPLFVSTDQYDSGSGWPTFSRCRFVNPILH